MATTTAKNHNSRPSNGAVTLNGKTNGAAKSKSSGGDKRPRSFTG